MKKAKEKELLILDEHEKNVKKSAKNKKTTDELIEEYERKITKTKQLLEEEKNKAKLSPKTQTGYNHDIHDLKIPNS